MNARMLAGIMGAVLCSGWFAACGGQAASNAGHGASSGGGSSGGLGASGAASGQSAASNAASQCLLSASSLSQCPQDPGSATCETGTCGLDRLPTGTACLTGYSCAMAIAPVAGCGRIDGYVCTCVGGTWSCVDCWLGTVSCEEAGSSTNDAGTSTDANMDTDSAACEISASNYDQSCTEDTDCTEVTSGDYCSPNLCECGGSAVNVGATDQFNADIAKASMGIDASSRFECPCVGPLFPPCCFQGQCSFACDGGR